MSEGEREIERTDVIVDIVEKILNFNNQNQTGKRLKILTPDQMFSKLPLVLAQLKIRNNNSEKLLQLLTTTIFFVSL